MGRSGTRQRDRGGIGPSSRTHARNESRFLAPQLRAKSLRAQPSVTFIARDDMERYDLALVGLQ